MKKHIVNIAAIAGLATFCTVVVAVSMHSCAPEQLHQTDVEPRETTISLSTDDPCGEEHTINAQWCMHPTWGGMFWGPGQCPEDECLNPNSQTAFDHGSGTWTFRTTLPTCTTFFEIPDSQCEWLHDGYIWDISQTWDFWETTVRFPEAWVDCVQQIADEDEMWCFEIRMRVQCP